MVSESDSPFGSISTLVVMTSGLSSTIALYSGSGSRMDREESESELGRDTSRWIVRFGVCISKVGMCPKCWGAFGRRSDKLMISL